MKITKKQMPKGSVVQPGKSSDVEDLEVEWLRGWVQWLRDNRYRHVPFLPIRQAAIIPDRLFRWDFAFVKNMIVVEIQGGDKMARSGHNSPGRKARLGRKGYKGGLDRDAEKSRLAAAAGYRQVTFTGSDVHARRGYEELARALGVL